MAGGSRRFTLDIPPEVADVIRHLPPDVKRGVKAALRALSVNPHEGVPLVRELEGKWRYRVRRYRVVYEIDSRARALRVVAVAYRRHIYEQLAARLRCRLLPVSPLGYVQAAQQRGGAWSCGHHAMRTMTRSSQVLSRSGTAAASVR